MSTAPLHTIIPRQPLIPRTNNSNELSVAQPCKATNGHLQTIINADGLSFSYLPIVTTSKMENNTVNETRTFTTPDNILKDLSSTSTSSSSNTTLPVYQDATGDLHRQINLTNGADTSMDRNLAELLRTVSTPVVSNHAQFTHLTCYGPQARWTIPSREDNITKFWLGYCRLREQTLDPFANICLAERQEDIMPLIGTFKFKFDAKVATKV